jgi:hypothetical protein
MITIIGDFLLFSAKKIGVILKNQCYDPNFTKIINICTKNDTFSQTFWRKYFQNYQKSVPGHPEHWPQVSRANVATSS